MIKTKLIIVSLASSLAAALTCGTARADHETGLEASIRPGYGSAGSSSPVVYAPSSGARLSTAPDAI
ncbi:MAG: hypothetical protein ABI551_06270, partial [Polyangiaceae bacterium]